MHIKFTYENDTLFKALVQDSILLIIKYKGASEIKKSCENLIKFFIRFVWFN